MIRTEVGESGARAGGGVPWTNERCLGVAIVYALVEGFKVSDIILSTLHVALLLSCCHAVERREREREKELSTNLLLCTKDTDRCPVR